MLQDFRAEFRTTMGGVVNKEAYSADMRTLDTKLLALMGENAQLRKELEAERNDRKSLRNMILTTILGVIGTFIVALVK